MFFSLNDSFHKKSQFELVTAVTEFPEILDWGKNGDDLNERLAFVCMSAGVVTGTDSTNVLIELETSMDKATWTTLLSSTRTVESIKKTGILASVPSLPTGILRYVKVTCTVPAGFRADVNCGVTFDKPPVTYNNKVWKA